MVCRHNIFLSQYIYPLLNEVAGGYTDMFCLYVRASDMIVSGA